MLLIRSILIMALYYLFFQGGIYPLCRIFLLCATRLLEVLLATSTGVFSPVTRIGNAANGRLTF